MILPARFPARFAASRTGGLVLLVALAASVPARAAIEVLAAQAPAPPPGAPTAAVYLSLRNTGPQADQLLGLATPVAGMAMIHSERVEAGVMRMQAEAALPLAPGATVAMHAGGTHVMLMDLKRALVAGQRFPIILRMAKAGEVHAEVAVLPLGSRP
jgi:copper(I)-binding protein